jgi:hypothetical protein
MSHAGRACRATSARNDRSSTAKATPGAAAQLFRASHPLDVSAPETRFTAHLIGSR